MSPHEKITKTFTVEEWAMICKGVLVMAAAVNYDSLSDDDTDRMRYLISLCADINHEIIYKAFSER